MKNPLLRIDSSSLQSINDFCFFICENIVYNAVPILFLHLFSRKSRLIWKDPDAGKDWGQEEKGTTEEEMVGWHLQLNGHGFVWTLGVGDGQGGLACCGSWGRKESDTTEWLNWTELNWETFNPSIWPRHNLYKPKYFTLVSPWSWDC